MKKKILVGLLVLASIVGIAYAATGICQNYSKGNGLVVTTKPAQRSTDVIIKSTVNEDITITSFSVSNGRSSSYTSPVGKDISKRGSITVRVGGSVSEDQISVTAQTCD